MQACGRYSSILNTSNFLSLSGSLGVAQRRGVYWPPPKDKRSRLIEVLMMFVVKNSHYLCPAPLWQKGIRIQHQA